MNPRNIILNKLQNTFNRDSRVDLNDDLFTIKNYSFVFKGNAKMNELNEHTHTCGDIYLVNGRLLVYDGTKFITLE